MKNQPPVKSPFSSLRQLHEDVQRLANEMRDRQKHGWAPRKAHVKELYEIALKLKLLDMNPKADISKVELTEFV